MLALLKRLGVLVDFILLSEVNFINWLFNLALEGIFERGDLVMLGHSVSRHVVGIQIGAQLVVSVHINFLLQLSANILVSIVISKMLVELVVSVLVFSFGSA